MHLKVIVGAFKPTMGSRTCHSSDSCTAYPRQSTFFRDGVLCSCPRAATSQPMRASPVILRPKCFLLPACLFEIVLTLKSGTFSSHRSRRINYLAVSAGKVLTITKRPHPRVPQIFLVGAARSSSDGLKTTGNTYELESLPYRAHFRPGYVPLTFPSS